MRNLKSLIFSIRFRLMLLLSLGLLILVGYFLYVASVDRQQEKDLYKSRLQSREVILDGFVKSSSDALYTYAFDYTYWDDMVAFVAGGGEDIAFADENIAASLATFKADVVWVYDKDKKLIYNVSGFDEESGFDPVATQAISHDDFGELFKENGVFSYYAKTDKGVFEVHAATVHPTADDARATPAAGYFFVGKLLGEDYLKAAGNSIEGKTELSSDPSKTAGINLEFEESTGKIVFLRELKDFKGQTAANLVATYLAADLRDALATQDRLNLLGLILIGSLTTALVFILLRFVIFPLQHVQPAMTLQKDEPIAKLLKRNDEYGSLSRLISESFVQQKLLLAQKQIIEKEVMERTAQLKNEQQMLSTLLDNLPVGVFVARAPDGEPIMINRKGIEILGRGIEPGIDSSTYRQFYQTIKEDGSAYPNDQLPLNITLREGKPAEKDDLIIKRPDGIQVSIRVTSAPIRNAEGGFRTAVAVFEDITEERRLERTRDEFFSIASHELRTPLTAIRGNTSMIRDYFGDEMKSPEFKEMVADIHESSVRLIEIVNDFLDTSRLEQRRMKYNMETFDVVAEADRVIRQFQVTSSRRKIAMHLEHPLSGLPPVRADADRARQVLINLIGNALKFTEEGGIMVSFEREDGHIKILVKDTGKGISHEAQQLLFRKFEQSGENVLTRDSVRGTGLGLYISKMIAEQMDGSVRLEHSELGKGSTFSFSLPIARSNPQPPSQEVLK